MAFKDTGINRSDSPISDQDLNIRRRNYSSLDYDLSRLRGQIFESTYRKTDLIRVNHELSNERHALKRRNRELEAGILEAEMIREEMKNDLEVSRERVSELEREAKDNYRFLSEIAESVRSVEDRLSKSMGCLNNENVPEGGRGKKLETEENNSKSTLELLKEVETKLETFMDSMEKNKMELSRSVEFFFFF